MSINLPFKPKPRNRNIILVSQSHAPYSIRSHTSFLPTFNFPYSFSILKKPPHTRCTHHASFQRSIYPLHCFLQYFSPSTINKTFIPFSGLNTFLSLVTFSIWVPSSLAYVYTFSLPSPLPPLPPLLSSSLLSSPHWISPRPIPNILTIITDSKRLPSHRLMPHGRR